MKYKHYLSSYELEADEELFGISVVEDVPYVVTTKKYPDGTRRVWFNLTADSYEEMMEIIDEDEP